ncbi:hypothetical protein Bca52824_024758 [Brassica carinata]|uniref:DUF1985 domain-containing protein n=1 Tax=Brassica carinata TaxID=52824 RepID=A0A8X7VKZ5_BRACI|nr:hypothetical protein Bca52824_024758 [Brassica carinata]
MPGWRKLCLALIMIVDGVLIAHQQTPRPTLKYVKMLKNVHTFCAHPWGRESFLKTITCMKPPKYHPVDCTDPEGTLVQLLKQESFRLQGFPLGLQLLAYQTVPKLLTTIPIPFDTRSIMDLVEPHLPSYPAPTNADILRVEWDPDLVVTSTIPILRQPQPGWGVWADVCKDDRVAYMEQLIADQRPFGKHVWYGGDTSVPLYRPEPDSSDEDVPIVKLEKREAGLPRKKVTKPRAILKEACRPRKTAKKAATARKQRRISSYFQAASSSSTSEDKLFELLYTIKGQVDELQKDSKEMRKLLKRKKLHQCHKTFQTLHRQSKKSKKATRGCQTETASELTKETMEEEPIVSQYQAQLHRSAPPTKSRNYLTTENTAPRQVDQEPLHNSPNHKVTVPNEPFHTTPDHTMDIHDGSHNTPTTTPASAKPPSVIYDTSAHPNSLPCYHLRSHVKEIFEPPSAGQPRYDSSNKPPSKRQIFPLAHQPFTPEPSPKKSSDSLPGFIAHATSTNAFSATASSSPLSFEKSSQPDEEQSSEDGDVVYLSDGSPARESPRHMPTLEEASLAEELSRCQFVHAPDLISPLPQAVWELFEEIVTKYKDAFHITPSKFDFHNSFLLKLAEPQKWTDTLIVDAKRMDILHDLQRLKDETRIALDSQISLLSAREQELKQEVSDQIRLIYEAIDVFKREINQKLDSHAIKTNFQVSTVTSPWKKLAASLAISGALSFLYWKVM